VLANTCLDFPKVRFEISTHSLSVCDSPLIRSGKSDKLNLFLFSLLCFDIPANADLHKNLARFQRPLPSNLIKPQAAFLQQVHEQQHKIITARLMHASDINPSKTALLKLSGLSKLKSKSE